MNAFNVRRPRVSDDPTPENLRKALADPSALHDILDETLSDKRNDLINDLRALSDSTVGRERLASEQRQFDTLEDHIGLIDKVTARRTDVWRAARSKKEAREVEAAALRVASGLFPDTHPTRSGNFSFGDELRNAIEEVQDGRAVAFVEFENRALSEGGSGGYGVPTAFGAPVFSLAARSVVMNIPGIVQVSADNGDRMRFPRFNAVQIGGTPEAGALTAANADLDAIDIVYQKFSTYETLSTELEEDFNAAALTVLGQRMLRDLAARVDSGLIQGTGALDTVGIFSQPDVSTTSVAGQPADFDKVSEAVYQMELNDGDADNAAWIMHPRTWRIFKQIKTGISSDKTTLLEPDPQSAPKSLAGRPVLTSSQISITSGATSVGSTAALVDGSQLVVVTRRPARLEVSRDVNFSTDQVAIRATTRVGLGVVDPAGGISLLTDIRAS